MIGVWLAFRLLFAHAPPAAQAEAPALRVPDTIVVVAERGAEPLSLVPAAVSVLDREAISAFPAENLAELLDFVPGLVVLFPQSAGGVPMIVARGFFGAGEAEYLQLRVDGIPAADAESGVADWRRVRAEGVERVEVLRGSASAFYGDTALGGVVDVTTRLAPEEDGAGRLALAGGSFGTASADLGRSVALGRGGLRLAGSALHTDGFRSQSASDEGSLDLAAYGPLAAGSWRFDATASSRDREEPGPLTATELVRDRSGSDPLFRFDREDTERQRAALRFDLGERHPWRAALWASRRETKLLRTLLLVPGLGDRKLRSLDTESAGASLEGERRFTLAGRDSHLRAGLELAADGLDTTYREVGAAGATGEEVAAADARRERLAGFLAHAWQLSPRLRLATGLRWDSIRDRQRGGETVEHDALSPRIGLTVDLGRDPAAPGSLVGFVQVSRAFKAATVDQLFDPRPFPDFTGGSFVISNPDIEPQRARSIEAGLRGTTAAHRFELVAYRTAVEDEIDFDPATFRYGNLEGSLHQGVEAAASLFAGSPVRPRLAYTWTQAGQRSGPARGRQLKNIPRHVLRAGAGLDLPGGVGAEISGSWYADRWLDDANLLPLSDALVWDLRLARTLGRSRLRLDLLNLTNERYAPLGYALPDATGANVPFYFPAPGFAARAGVELRLRARRAAGSAPVAGRP